MDDPLHIRIAAALARIGALARSHEQQGAQDEALSPLQARVLSALLRRGGLRVGELAEELLVTYGTVSAAISSLEEKGLVAKYTDAEEHRAVLVELTRGGKQAAKRTRGHEAELLEPAVRELEPAAAGELHASLLCLIRSFERQGLMRAARICPSCRFFEPGGGSGARPHYCHLLEDAIGNAELQVDCPDHEAADATRQEELWEAFRAVP